MRHWLVPFRSAPFRARHSFFTLTLTPLFQHAHDPFVGSTTPVRARREGGGKRAKGVRKRECSKRGMYTNGFFIFLAVQESGEPGELAPQRPRMEK